MAIADITYSKGIYFFKGYLAKMDLDSSVTAYSDLFLVLMPAKMCTFKNIDYSPPIKSNPFNGLSLVTMYCKKNHVVLAFRKKPVR